MYIQVCCVGVLACVCVALVPYQDMLYLTKDSICGGETAFIYAYGGAGLPLWSVLGTPKNSSSSGQWEAGTWKERSHIYVYTYRCSVCVCVCVCVFMYIYMYMYVYTYMCVCVYLYISVYM